MTSLVSIYKSPKRAEMYLYLYNSASVEKTVPEALLRAFGKPKHVFDLLLTPAKKLARADTASVLQALSDTGYYLQLPPPEQDDYLITLPDELLSLNDPV